MLFTSPQVEESTIINTFDPPKAPNSIHCTQSNEFLELFSKTFKTFFFFLEILSVKDQGPPDRTLIEMKEEKKKTFVTFKSQFETKRCKKYHWKMQFAVDFIRFFWILWEFPFSYSVLLRDFRFFSSKSWIFNSAPKKVDCNNNLDRKISINEQSQTNL